MWRLLKPHARFDAKHWAAKNVYLLLDVRRLVVFGGSEVHDQKARRLLLDEVPDVSRLHEQNLDVCKKKKKRCI